MILVSLRDEMIAGVATDDRFKATGDVVELGWSSVLVVEEKELEWPYGDETMLKYLDEENERLVPEDDKVLNFGEERDELDWAVTIGYVEVEILLEEREKEEEAHEYIWDVDNRRIELVGVLAELSVIVLLLKYELSETMKLLVVGNSEEVVENSELVVEVWGHEATSTDTSVLPPAPVVVTVIVPPQDIDEDVGEDEDEVNSWDEVVVDVEGISEIVYEEELSEEVFEVWGHDATSIDTSVLPPTPVVVIVNVFPQVSEGVELVVDTLVGTLELAGGNVVDDSPGFGEGAKVEDSLELVVDTNDDDWLEEMNVGVELIIVDEAVGLGVVVVEPSTHQPPVTL